MKKLDTYRRRHERQLDMLGELEEAADAFGSDTARRRAYTRKRLAEAALNYSAAVRGLRKPERSRS